MSLRPYQSQLIEDTRNAYKSGFKQPCLVLGCGGGKSYITAEMVKVATLRGNQVLFIVHRRELCEQIRTTFTEWGVDMNFCQIAMVQTVTKRLKTTTPPQLIITDECQHGPANSYRRIYDKWPDVLRVSVTATPTRLNGGGLGSTNDILILGPTVKELIGMGYLAPFKYYAPEIVDTSKLHVRGGEFKPEEIEEMFAKNVIYGDVVKHYHKLSNGKAICYCSSIKQSVKMAQEFANAGVSAKHIDGSTPTIERDNIISEFRSGAIKVLCNVDIISEGFSLDDCSTVILLRPTQSLGLYIQQSMRCMRYQPGKTAVIIDHVGNVGRFGLPDAEREWTLDVKKKSNKIENMIKIKICPECFGVSPSASRVCVECGFEFRAKEKEIDVKKEAELVEIEQMEDFTMDYRQPKDCKNMSELYQLADNLGYKKGWCYHQGKILGFIK